MDEYKSTEEILEQCDEHQRAYLETLGFLYQEFDKNGFNPITIKLENGEELVINPDFNMFKLRDEVNKER